MSNSAKTLVGLIGLLLAGCATPPPKNSAQTPDWEELPAAAALPAKPAVPPLVATPAVGAPNNCPPPAPVFPAKPWIPLAEWAHANALPAPVRLLAGPAPIYGLRSTNGVFIVRTGSQLAHWNGLELHLGFAPRLIKGDPYLHWLDVQKTAQPLLAGGCGLGINTSPVIVIDPGHGGGDAGTRSVLDGHFEKEFTLDWARRLQRLLTACGWQALLTRSNDAELALSNRVAFAAEHKADLFLSLHFNSAAPSQNEAGLETYCFTPAGMPSTLTRGYADEVAQIFPNNAFDTQNLLLALQVHRALLDANGHHDRGVRRARFPAVLRGQQRPAILIEGGYLSNPREARLIADPAYRQALAEAVARGLGAEPSAISKAQGQEAGQARSQGMDASARALRERAHSAQSL